MGQSASNPRGGRRGSPGAALPLASMSGDYFSSLDEHTGAVLCCAFSSDEKLLITGSADCSALIWSLANGKAVTKLAGHSDAVTGCSFVGSLHAVTASRDGTAKVWQHKTGVVRARYTNHEGPLLGCRVSHDEQHIATCSQDKTVHNWLVERSSGPPAGLLRGHTGPVLDCRFSPDDMIIATCSSDNTIRLWNRRSSKVIAQLSDPLGPHSIVFSPNGVYMSVSSNDATIRIWNVNSEEVVNSMPGHTANATCCDFNCTGEVLASSSDDKTVRLWNPHDVGGKATKVMVGHKAEVTACVFSPSGRYLATTSGDKTCRVWK